MASYRHAARALGDGMLVVYPTETVYGLAANALDAEAVLRVFDAKQRSRENPLSLAVSDVERALRYTNPTDRDVRFMREFLPGPVTVVVERDVTIPDELTAGSDRVGIRIPDHDVAQTLLAEAGPVTATSANVSGNPSVRRPGNLDRDIRDRAAVVLDGGETPGGESTVVDVTADEILRGGTLAVEIQSWLERE